MSKIRRKRHHSSDVFTLTATPSGLGLLRRHTRRVRQAVRVSIAMLAALASAPAWAADAIDCPLRDAPFSTTSPLVDILRSPAASATLESELPDLLKGLPPVALGTEPPTFAAILDIQTVAKLKKLAPESLERLDAALAKLPVTTSDREKRCSRYDVDNPGLVVPRGKLRVLLFEKMTGFRDGPSVEAAHAAFVTMAKKKGWSLVTTDKGGAFTPDSLARFNVIIWNNVSGDVLTLSQRAAFQRYIESGGGFLAVHGSAGDPVTYWDWYVDTLIGARFLGHPMSKQFQNARINLDDPAHPIASGLPESWEMTDEWYSFKTNPRDTGARVIATLDEASYEQIGMGGQPLAMGDHPIAWTRCVGSGRAFYSAIGHRPELYADPLYVGMIERAIAWTANPEGSGCPA